jgi:hypothetical protein
MRYDTPSTVWSRLSALRDPLMRRVERYAALTIPKILLPEGLDVISVDQSHDYQSIGAQAINHVTNKLMLALFAPTRPFFKVQPGAKALSQLESQGIADADLAKVLGVIERKAIKQFDALGQRPKLYQCMRHLLIAGNVLLQIDKKALRVIGLRRFVVKRTIDGKLHTLVIRERIKFDELEQKVQGILPHKYNEDSEVDFYKMIQLQPGGGYKLCQAVNEYVLPTEFDGRYTEETLPYRVLTWDLADEADYATGLVEEYIGDLEALSIMAEGIVNSGTLGAEFRLMVNPTGLTNVDDVQRSKNGDALAGAKDDISPTQGGNPEAIRVLLEVSQRYERRIGSGFLMNSAVTREAERVTAEEIRLTAQELETAYGGVYSNLAVIVQAPVARWLLEGIDAKLQGTDLEVVVVTGLDGLSRTGDLENLRLSLDDLAKLELLPDGLKARLKYDAIVGYIGAGRGVDLAAFLKDEEQFQAEQEQLRQQQIEQEGQTAGAVAAGEAEGQAAAGVPA